MPSLIPGSPTRSPCACMVSQGYMDDDDVVMHDEDCPYQEENPSEDLPSHDEEAFERKPVASGEGKKQKKLTEAELDQKIRFLKLQNENLRKRHQEVQEDKRWAEQEAGTVRRKLGAGDQLDSRRAQETKESRSGCGVRRQLLLIRSSNEDALGPDSKGHTELPVPMFKDLRDYLRWKRDCQRHDTERMTHHTSSHVKSRSRRE